MMQHVTALVAVRALYASLPGIRSVATGTPQQATSSDCALQALLA